MAKRVRVGLAEIGEYFESLEDSRWDINQKHPSVSVLMIALMAVLAGADGPTAVARWGALKAEFLRKHLELPHGVPREDVFLRVLSALQPEAFQACFRSWLEAPGATDGLSASANLDHSDDRSLTPSRYPFEICRPSPTCRRATCVRYAHTS